MMFHMEPKIEGEQMQPAEITCPCCAADRADHIGGFTYYVCGTWVDARGDIHDAVGCLQRRLGHCRSVNEELANTIRICEGIISQQRKAIADLNKALDLERQKNGRLATLTANVMNERDDAERAAEAARAANHG